MSMRSGIAVITCILLAMGTTRAAEDVPVDISRLLILGCHRQEEPAPAIAASLSTAPDLVLWIGDNVYADTIDSPAYLRSCYEQLAAKPGFTELRALAPWLATWDDHDFGLNNAGGNYPLKEASRQLFREFWLLTETIPDDRDGVYYSKRFNTHGKALQVILLDPRYNRDDPGPASDTLGERQWTWLAERLAEPADLRLVVSGFQVLLPEDTGSETWAKFPAARKRLFDLIKQQRAEGVVFLTGDQHYGEVCRLRDALGYDAIELQFAGVNQTEDPEFNPLRVSAVSTSTHSYATLDFRWMRTDADVPHLLYRVCNAETGESEVAYRINLAELTRSGVAPDQTAVPAARVEPSGDIGPFAQAHAHNDYEHERPLADALAWGFCSVEADVYPVDGDLLVAHDRADLKPERTLQNLYLEPLLARLENEGRVQPGSDTFTLLVDIKTDGEAAYELLKRQLEPLRPFLEAAAGTAPLQVIISGDRPFAAITADTDRLVGIDGRLEDLDRDDRPAALVPLISDRWGKRFRWFGVRDMPNDERALLRELVRQAHARGQRLRFWAAPEDPLVWRELAAAGVDLIGTDDLAALAGFLDASQTLE